MQWNLADLFEAVCDAVADREAVVCGDRRYTFREHDERATRLAHALSARGVGPGDHVGLYMYNGPEYLEAQWAAWKLRAVPINVNYRYVEDELRYLFDNADLAGLVHGREFVPRIAAVRHDCPKLKVCFAIDDGSQAELSDIGALDYETEIASASPERDFPERSPDDLYVLYTGGTTGMPKGVMWRQRDFFLATIAPLLTLGGPLPESPEEVVRRAVEQGGGLVMFPLAPLMHGAAQWAAMMATYNGNELVLSRSRKLDPHEVWRTVEREKVLTVSLVGDAMARPLVDALDEPGASYDLSSLIGIGSGGAMLSPAVKERIHEQLPNVLVSDSIGASETGYQGTVAGSDDEGHPRFVMGEHTTVLDENMRPVAPGSGVVGWLARSGWMPLGYYKDEAKTRKTFVEIDGVRWALPGDMARVEADRTITLLGRGSVSINTGGEKVFPEEVENVLKADPAVFDAVVVGVPDERWGERVAAVVRPRPGMQPTLDELAAHAREHLAGYKVPRELCLVDEIVRSPSGKADYRWAKAVALAETGAPGPPA